MNKTPVVKFAISPTGTPVGLPYIIQYKIFLINSTAIPATGPIVMTAKTAGISPKSIFKKGGKAGSGKLKRINTVAILPNIAMRIILRNFLLFICSSLLLRFTSKEERWSVHMCQQKIPKAKKALGRVRMHS